MTTTHSTAVQWFLNNQRMTSHTKDQTPEQGALESAQDYAMAEQTAQERGWEVQWTEDGDDYPGWMPGETPSLVAILDDGEGNSLAAMGGIEASATDDWKRAIAAELALEAIEEGN